MMMSKPAPEATEEEAPPAFAAPPAAAAKTGSVEDLERRLAMLGDAADDAKKPAAAPVNTDALQAPVAAVQAPAAAAPAVVKGGKNALLVCLECLK